MARGQLFARPIEPRGSPDLAAYARGDALVRITAASPAVPASARCEVLPLAGWPLPDARG